MLEQLQLAIRALGENRCAEWLHNLLHSYGLASQLIFCGTDKPEGTHSDRLKVSISAGDFEGGAKDLCPNKLGHGGETWGLCSTVEGC